MISRRLRRQLLTPPFLYAAIIRRLLFDYYAAMPCHALLSLFARLSLV